MITDSHLKASAYLFLGVCAWIRCATLVILIDCPVGLYAPSAGQVIKLNTKDTTATGPCHFFRSKDHLAYLRLGNDAMVGDTKATYDAAKKTIT